MTFFLLFYENAFINCPGHFYNRFTIDIIVNECYNVNVSSDKKGNIINNLPLFFNVEHEPNPNRIFLFNKGVSGEGPVLYLIDRELRCADNYALLFAAAKAASSKRPLKICHLFHNFDSEEKQIFYEDELDILRLDMKKNNLDFKIVYDKDAYTFVNEISPACVVIDFDPIRDEGDLERLKYTIYEVDSHNIVPARVVSDKQEYNAFQFRKHIYHKIYEYFTEFPETYSSNSEGYKVLNDFIENKLDRYADEKNNPDADVVSGLSPYIKFGFLSAQRVALEIYKSDTLNKNKEAFLEELIVRKELADNFCLYNKNYKNLRSVQLWAVRSLLKHKNDFRPVLFSRKELENANTSDIIWNAAQKELVQTGKIHGYLRMYWAKMLLQWTETPMDAIDTAIYLNDKYAFDAPSPNGYVGILWSIAGLHDRAFREESISGKVRRMSYSVLYQKLKNGNYLKKFGPV